MAKGTKDLSRDKVRVNLESLANNEAFTMLSPKSFGFPIWTSAAWMGWIAGSGQLEVNNNHPLQLPMQHSLEIDVHN